MIIMVIYLRFYRLGMKWIVVVLVMIFVEIMVVTRFLSIVFCRLIIWEKY